MGVHRAVPADRRVRPDPERLRKQFEGVIWRFKTGGQWREMPREFGAWPTVHNGFRQWRDAGVFEALLEGLIAEAAKRGTVDLSLVGIDSTTARAHHDAAGTHLDQDVLTAQLKAWRGIATRYDKTPDSYLAGLHLRASMIWTKELALATH